MLRRVMMAVSGASFSGLTFDPALTDPSISLSSGNRTATGASNYGGQTMAISPRSSGAWYIEASVDVYGVGVGSNGIGILGLATASSTLSDYLGRGAGCCGIWGVGNSVAAYLAGSTTTPGLSYVAGGDVFGMAWDADTGRVWYSKNGAWFGNPSAGTSPAHSSSSLTGLHHVASGPRNLGNKITLRATPSFPVPSGFAYWSA